MKDICASGMQEYNSTATEREDGRLYYEKNSTLY